MTLTSGALEAAHLMVLLASLAFAGLSGWITVRLTVKRLEDELARALGLLEDHQKDDDLHMPRELMGEKLARLQEGMRLLREEVGGLHEDLRALRQLFVKKGD